MYKIQQLKAVWDFRAVTLTILSHLSKVIIAIVLVVIESAERY